MNARKIRHLRKARWKWMIFIGLLGGLTALLIFEWAAAVAMSIMFAVCVWGIFESQIEYLERQQKLGRRR